MPGCKSVCTIGPDLESAAGWVYLADGYGVSIDGVPRRDFCSIHSRMSLAELAESVRP